MSDRGAIVVGASTGVGRAIAQRLARDGWELVIGSRSLEDLEAVATDLRIRHDAMVTAVPVDVAGPDSKLDEFLTRARDTLSSVDAVIITVGAILDVDDGTNDWAGIERLIATNMTGVIKLAGDCVAAMEDAEVGTVVLFSSIAAAAPRRRNVVYAAAKAGLESYGRSMRHRLAESPVSVQVYALGYVDTAMTKGQDLRLPPTDPAKVADRVVDNIDVGSFVRYEPRWWRPIVGLLKFLPWPIYRRLDF